MAPNLDKFCHRFCLQCACNDCKNGDHLGGAILSCVPGPPQEAQFWLIWIIIVSWAGGGGGGKISISQFWALVMHTPA